MPVAEPTRAEQKPAASPVPTGKPELAPWQRSLRALAHQLDRAWDRVGRGLANYRRHLLRKRLPDYAVIVLDHAISERAPLVPWYYAYLPSVKLPLSLEYLHRALEHVAGDPDVRGVVFLLKGPALSLAQAQSLVQLLARFRRWDSQWRAAGAAPKEIITHLEQANAAAYVVAVAADRITMPPLASWDVMGLRIAPTYWKETLDRVGVAFDVVKIAPWKTAADSFVRRDMSDAERDQNNWLLDSLSDDIIRAISDGRHLPTEQVTALINQAPLTAQQALTAGLIDSIAYEDQLATLLAKPATAISADAGKPARLKPYAQVRSLLYHRPKPQAERAIGVLSLEGTMIVGDSRSYPLPLPLLGDKMMGSNTVEQQIRAARQNRGLAAVIVHVDTGGGSALASDLIWRELVLLDQEKPLVIYMGNVAASGGYYIATPGRRIIAQSATITGSIGVVTAKSVTTDLRAKIGANREIIRRGENAGLYSDDQAWTERQRHKIEEQIMAVYGTFKRRVAEGRHLPYDGLDEIANGRVWTGKQALAHGLVDELGDFDVAYRFACESAGLPDDGSVRTVTITPPRTRLMATPTQPTPQAWQQVVLGEQANRGLMAWANALVQGEWLRHLAREQIWLIMPNLPRIE